MICPRVVNEYKSQDRERDVLEGTRGFKEEKEMDRLPSGEISKCQRPATGVHKEK